MCHINNQLIKINCAVKMILCLK